MPIRDREAQGGGSGHRESSGFQFSTPGGLCQVTPPSWGASLGPGAGPRCPLNGQWAKKQGASSPRTRRPCRGDPKGRHWGASWPSRMREVGKAWEGSQSQEGQNICGAVPPTLKFSPGWCERVTHVQTTLCLLLYIEWFRYTWLLMCDMLSKPCPKRCHTHFGPLLFLKDVSPMNDFDRFILNLLLSLSADDSIQPDNHC